ncbi:tyrosine-type recombinase/integrase [Acinetobacter sp. WCHA39]|uniref:tyrosine-type recombinase/integrase n=1 Tax=Acinetobacter sp. WCHA39 TaxID=2004648 RepID=UPI000B3BE31E|nr:integrase arm-type DNA-binding domain-containing protein [Acinetobacter sp. WCHA39]
MLNDTKLRTLKPTEKLYRITDFDGLCIEVKPTGKKFWRFRFRYLDKALMMTLGEYPVVGLAEARRLRDDAKALLHKGVNPIEDRVEKKQEEKNASKNTFKLVAEEYIENKIADRTEKYKQQMRDSFERDVYRVIGNKAVKDVTSHDVLKIMENTLKRVQGQNNYGTGEVTAIQNRKFIGAVMRYAIATLRADYDPTYAVRDVIERPEVEHARPLEKQELRILRTKIDTYKGSKTVRNAVLAMLYSMLRSIEIRRMQWSFIDFEDKTIKFPIATKKSKAKSKTQERTTKKNRIHIVPISTQLLELLIEQKKITGSQDYVFSAIYKEGMLSATTLNRMLDYINLGDVSAHDFRATASTFLYEKGYEEDWIELQLAHADENKTKASYNHAKHLENRRKMLQDWADIVDSWKD